MSSSNNPRTTSEQQQYFSSLSSSSTSGTMSSSINLPTTTTFLPILDDLLSPDFRPVTYPPVTPLQTPTANNNPSGLSMSMINYSTNVNVNANNAAAAVLKGSGGSDGVGGNNTTSGSNLVGGSVNNGEGDGDEAALKIQKWWKKNNGDDRVAANQNGGGGGEEDDDSDAVENVKHSIRHQRADEHIRHLESELSRLKSTLSAERKLRSLQYEAIRSLWSQVQKLSVNNTTATNDQSLGIMSQSCPNGLPQTASPPQLNKSSCTCSSEIKELKHKIESEVGELRGLISLLLTDRSCADSGTAAKVDDDNTQQQAGNNGKKRPDTLDLLSKGQSGQPPATGEELQGYADDMAKFVVERGLSDNNNSGGGGNRVSMIEEGEEEGNERDDCEKDNCSSGDVAVDNNEGKE